MGLSAIVATGSMLSCGPHIATEAARITVRNRIDQLGARLSDESADSTTAAMQASEAAGDHRRMIPRLNDAVLWHRSHDFPNEP